MALAPAFNALAQTLQEAAQELSHSDIAKGLADCLNDTYPDCCCHVCDVYGDDDSGDVVYYKDGQYLRAPYEIGFDGDQRQHSIDTDNAANVLPRTVYDEEAGEDGNGDMGEARKKNLIERFPDSSAWRHRPFAERFISKSERDSADASDFAGTGRSFPILRPKDVMAAVHSIGRGVAGGQSAGSLKRNIKSIAKRKGWSKHLPQNWQDEGKDGESKDESRRSSPDGVGRSTVRLVESAALATGTRFEEASAANALAKIISPGRGSCGYYTKEVLERDGPEIFKRGTLMYINHATPAEEAERPEGDWSKLAGVTTGDAYWDEHGKDGAALYAPAKFFSEYASQVNEKAAYTGLSIRARGHYAEAKRLAPDGKPGLIERLVVGDSIDLVTKAGRDGKLLLESANEGVDMDESVIRDLRNEVAALRETIAGQTEGPRAIREALEGIRLPGPPNVVEATRARIIERISPALPFKAGRIDTEALKAMAEAFALEEARYLGALGFGVGIASAGKRMTEAEIAKLHEDDGKARNEQFEETMSRAADIFVGQKIQEGESSEAERQNRKRMRRIFKEGRAA